MLSIRYTNYVPNKEDLVAYYKFDESGCTHIDYSLNRNYFTYTRYLPSMENIAANNFLQEGDYYNSSYIIKPGTGVNDLGVGIPIPSISTDATVEMWVLFPILPTSGYQSILGVNNRQLQAGFEIVYYSTSQILWCNFMHTFQTNMPLNTTYTFSQNSWTHIACISSGTLSYMQLFVNGAVMQTIGYIAYTPGKIYLSFNYRI